MKWKVILKKLKSDSPIVKSQSTISSSALTPQTETKVIPSFDDALKSAASAEGKPLPKKRGRPMGAKNVSHVGAAPGIPSSSAPSASPLSNPVAPQTVPLDIPKEVLIPVINFPYSIAAKRTGFSGFKLDKEECDAIIPLVDQCLKQYLPSVTGPHAAAVALLGTISVITALKYSAYLDFKNESAKEKNAKFDREESPAPREAQIMPGVHV